MKAEATEEAEAALLALGPRLVWLPCPIDFTPPDGFCWERARHDTDTGYRLYEVMFEPHVSPRVRVAVSYWHESGDVDGDELITSRGNNLYFTGTVAKARAAAETHAATGKWD